MIEDVRLAVNGKVKVEHFGRLGGIVPDPDEIVEALAKLKSRVENQEVSANSIFIFNF